MNIGTKSLLYGAHQFLIHPIFVFLAWWRLYGFPWDPRLWIVFLVHDWGYWGKPNMDGEEGEKHIIAGAVICSFLFDRVSIWRKSALNWIPKLFSVFGVEKKFLMIHGGNGTWFDLSYYHSRFIAKQDDREPSALCAPDKLATCITPRFLYMPFVKATGEVWEYVHAFTEAEENRGKYAKEVRQFADQALKAKLSVKGTREEVLERWYFRMRRHMRRWSYTHAPAYLFKRKIYIAPPSHNFKQGEHCDNCLKYQPDGELCFFVKRPTFCSTELVCESCALKLEPINKFSK